MKRSASVVFFLIALIPNVQAKDLFEKLNDAIDSGREIVITSYENMDATNQVAIGTAGATALSSIGAVIEGKRADALTIHANELYEVHTRYDAEAIRFKLELIKSGMTRDQILKFTEKVGKLHQRQAKKAVEILATKFNAKYPNVKQELLADYGRQVFFRDVVFDANKNKYLVSLRDKRKAFRRFVWTSVAFGVGTGYLIEKNEEDFKDLIPLSSEDAE